MKASALARRALPMTFVLYVLQALLGLNAVLPAALELVPAWAYTAGARLEALRLEALLDLAAVGRVSLRTLGLTALLVLMLGPFLQMSWLSALAEPGSVQAAFARGARLTPRAWLVSLLVCLLGALVAAPVLAAAYGVHHWLDGSADVRTHDLAVAVSLVPLLPIACVAHVLHDVARTRALYLRAGRSAFGGLRPALRPRVLARAALAWTLGMLAVAGATLLAQPLAALGIASLTSTALLQGALLARLVARSWWLACALLQIGQVAPEVRVEEA